MQPSDLQNHPCFFPFGHHDDNDENDDDDDNDENYDDDDNGDNSCGWARQLHKQGFGSLTTCLLGVCSAVSMRLNIHFEKYILKSTF